MEICVVIKKCVQVGPDDWDSHTITRVFNGLTSIENILLWVKSTGVKNPTVNDFILAEHISEGVAR